MKKIICTIFTLLLLYGCATELSEKATTENQDEVKNQVMKLLEQEYKQLFKLEDFSYKYETHYPSGNCSGQNCGIIKYGTYHFKIQAVDNPIIEMNFDIKDKNKESINDVIDSFKKNQLHDIFCIGLWKHYIDNKKSLNDKLTKQEIETNKYCDARGQKEDYDNIYTRY